MCMSSQSTCTENRERKRDPASLAGNNFQHRALFYARKKQYADFGDFGRLYKMPSASLNPDPLILHASLR